MSRGLQLALRNSSFILRYVSSPVGEVDSLRGKDKRTQLHYSDEKLCSNFSQPIVASMYEFTNDMKSR